MDRAFGKGCFRMSPCGTSMGILREKRVQRYNFILNYANFYEEKSLFCANICTFHLFLVSLHVKKMYKPTMRRTIIILSVLAVCLLGVGSRMSAQDKSIRDAGLERRDFFDPTRTEKVEEQYSFSVSYRLEGGYAQDHQRMTSDTISALYLHGARVGAQFDLMLPKHFSLNIGVLYSVLYGISSQHYRSVDTDPDLVQTEVVNNHVVEHALIVPVRAQYNIPLWKKLSMHFYTGPQLMIGLAQTDYVKADLSDATRDWLLAQGKHLDTYDKYTSGELFRANIMYGLGGGFTWDKYRLEAGYDFGLNNLIRTPIYSKDRMSEWQWHVSFVYTL